MTSQMSQNSCIGLVLPHRLLHLHNWMATNQSFQIHPGRYGVQGVLNPQQYDGDATEEQVIETCKMNHVQLMEKHKMIIYVIGSRNEKNNWPPCLLPRHQNLLTSICVSCNGQNGKWRCRDASGSSCCVRHVVLGHINYSHFTESTNGMASFFKRELYGKLESSYTWAMMGMGVLQTKRWQVLFCLNLANSKKLTRF